MPFKKSIGTFTGFKNTRRPRISRPHYTIITIIFDLSYWWKTIIIRPQNLLNWLEAFDVFFFLKLKFTTQIKFWNNYLSTCSIWARDQCRKNLFGYKENIRQINKNGSIPASAVVHFRSFLVTISIIQIEKSVDCVLGIWTQGRSMVGRDETTELWRPPIHLPKLMVTLNMSPCFSDNQRSIINIRTVKKN